MEADRLQPEYGWPLKSRMAGLRRPCARTVVCIKPDYVDGDTPFTL